MYYTLDEEGNNLEICCKDVIKEIMILKRKLLCLRKLAKKHSKSTVCKEIEKVINVKLV